jgi:serine/threonine-protein kinase
VDTRLDPAVANQDHGRPDGGDPAFRTRFVREARSAPDRPPAVVDVFDQGNHHGPDARLFCDGVVEGGTLRDVLRLRGARACGRDHGAGPRARRLARPTGSAWCTATSNGDVLISTRARSTVADFGLVVAAAEAGPATPA